MYSGTFAQRVDDCDPAGESSGSRRPSGESPGIR
jgi:hypothetical protein